MQYRGNPLFTGIKMLSSPQCRKKGQVIQVGDMYYANKDDMKQIARNNAVGRRRFERMRLIAKLPAMQSLADRFYEDHPKKFMERFIEEDRKQVGFAMFYDVMTYR